MGTNEVGSGSSDGIDPGHPLGSARRSAAAGKHDALTPGRLGLPCLKTPLGDPETLEALHALSDRAVAGGVLVIMTARAAERPGWTRWSTGDVDEALTWFRRASSTAYAHGMPLWRARALHELATISQLRDLTVDDLLRAREAAVDAGAPGLVASVDFHLAAIHGVRFEVPEAMAAGQRVLDGARRLALPRQQAWGWILIGQARAATADREPVPPTAAGGGDCPGSR